MNAFLDDLLVGLALLAGFGYALCALGPKSLRARLLNGAAVVLARLPTAAARGIAQRLAAAAAGGKAACGGCDGCGSKAADAGPEAVARPPEINIPLAKIGRRRVDRPSPDRAATKPGGR